MANCPPVDNTSGKTPRTYLYPVRSTHVPNVIRRREPLLTPAKLRSRWLHGIDVSSYTDEQLNDIIMMSYNEAEKLTDLFFEPIRFNQKVMFDRNLYRSFIFLRMNNSPIQCLHSLKITSSKFDDRDPNVAKEDQRMQHIYQVPQEWIDTSHFYRGEIHVVPLLSTYGYTGTSAGSLSEGGALVFLTTIGHLHWLPAFWEIDYVAGLSPEPGQVPVLANNLIGVIAAGEVLGQLGPVLFPHTSVSISQDGISQSHGSLGPRTYEARMKDLGDRKDKYVKELKATFSNRYFLSNI